MLNEAEPAPVPCEFQSRSNLTGDIFEFANRRADHLTRDFGFFCHSGLYHQNHLATGNRITDQWRDQWASDK